MDDFAFDSLTRSLNRRGLGALALLGLGAGLAPVAADAKKKKCQPKCKACRKCVKGRCKPAKNGTLCPGGVCQNKQCKPILEICADGVRNGNETGVDCGGSCARCGNGNPCQDRNDCESAFCKPGVNQCQVCQSKANCPRDNAGSCTCETTVTGGVCLRAVASSSGVANCPNGQEAIPNGQVFDCFKRCGA